ncbi:MAG: T9SS type A sorting domain-containing protein, partial [Chitinophagaceae bacterium]
KKVTICHIPKGNPTNAHTITVAKQAAKAHIGRHGGDYYGECKTMPGAGGGNGEVKTEFTCTSVKVTSTGDPLAYAVLVFADNTRERFDNLNGTSGTFAGTGDNAGKTIKGIFVKTSAMMETDCNGCGDYFKNTANCNGNGGGGTAEVSVNCTTATVSSDVIIETVTLAFDDGSVQVFEINAKTASVSPINEYEGYFIMGAYVQLQGGTTVTTTEYGETVNGDYYENPNFEECDELVNPGLPVKMTKFEAKKVEANVVKLEWTTASETNNDYIAIEKSSDIENWKEVCRVKSDAEGGNSQHVHDYSCYDHNANEDGQNIVYYRPKQVDLNGTFEYHNTIRLRLMDAAYKTEIESVYPNPVADRLNIRYNTAENGQFSIRLIGLDGKSLLQNKFVARPGVQTVDLDLMEDKLKPGLYVLEIQTDGEVFRQKVYKQ